MDACFATGSEDLRLLGNRQTMIAVDHRFALRRPILLSAPLLSAPGEKSLANVSSPSLACSVFTLTTSAASVFGSDPNTPAAPFKSALSRV